MPKYNRWFVAAVIIVIVGMILTACDSNEKSKGDGISALIVDSFFGIKLGATRDEVIKLKDTRKEGLKFKGDVQTGENRFIYYWDEPVMSFEVTDNKVTKINLSFYKDFKFVEEVFNGKLKSFGTVSMDTIKSVYGVPQDQKKDRNTMMVYTYESKDQQYVARFIEGENSLSMFLEKNEE